MKSLLYTAIAASILAIPVVSFAQQSNAPITRAQVRAELIQIEQAGYTPGRRDPNYPEDIQAAQTLLSVGLRVQNVLLAQDAGYNIRNW